MIRKLLGKLVALGTAIAWLVGGTGTAFHPTPCAAQTLEVQHDLDVIRGMRQRHLFELAETLCRRHLENRELTPTQAVELTNELIQILAAAAIVSDGPQRAEKFDAADAVAQQFLERNSDHPRRVLVAVQRALTHQLHGKLLVQERAAQIASDDAVPLALNELRTATRLMDQIVADIDRLIPEQRSRSLGPDDLSVEQLMNLKRNLQFQLATTELIKAQLYAADDRLNRIDTLNQVIQRLDDVLRQSNDQQPLWWKTQLARIRAQLLMGQVQESAARLRGLPVQAMPGEVRPEFEELWIELAIQSPDLDQANEIVQRVMRSNSVPPALALTALRWIAAQVSAAKSESDQKRWLDIGTSWLKNIERQHGPYWGRRAELALIGPASNDNDSAAGAMSSDAELLVRIGDQAARQQRWEDALRAYEKALSQAVERQSGAEALVIAAKQAQVLESLNRNLDAGQLLTSVATQFPNVSTAAAVHLRGCWNLSRGLGTSIDAKQWETTLGEHLKRWPNGATSDRVRRWLGQHLVRQGSDVAALETLLSISADSPEWTAIYDLVLTSWNRLLKQSPDRSLVQRLLNQIDRSLQASGAPTSLESHLVQQLLKARIGLTAGEIDPETALQQLDQIIQKSTDEHLRWKREAIAWKVVALVAANQIDQATSLLSESLPPNERLMATVHDGLQTVLDESRWRSIDGIRTLLARKALADPDVSDPLRWQLAQARALMDRGENRAAAELLEQLVAENPRSLELRLQRARALTADAPDSAQALIEWRRIAAQVKPHGRAWYEAKLNTARILAAQGNEDQALKLLRYLKTVPPGWDGSPFATELEALLRELEEKK